MKKYFTLLLCLLLVIVLVACSTAQPTSTPDKAPSAVTETAPADATPATVETTPAQAESAAAEAAPMEPTQPSAPSEPAPEVAPSVPAEETISRDRAIELALSEAGLTKEEVRDLEAELDRERQGLVWEVDFESGKMEYSYDIDAITEEIVKVERDRD